MKIKKLLLLFFVVLIIGVGFLFSQRFHPAIYSKMGWLYGKEIGVTETTNLEGTAILASEFNHENLVYYSSMGLHLSPKKVQEMHLITPQMMSNGDYFLVYDRGGKTASVYYKNKELYTVSSKHDIQNAKVNDCGYLVLISDQPGYQAIVSVYNRKGKNIYKVYSGEKYVLDADIHENGKRLAISQYATSGDELMSYVAFYHLDEREPYQVSESSETVFAAIKFLKNGKLLTVGETQTAAFSSNGEEDWRYEYVDGTLQTFSVSNYGVALVLGQQNQKVVLLNNNGKIHEYIHQGGDITQITNNKSGVLFAANREVFFLNKQAYLLANLQVARDISELYLEETGKNGVIRYEAGYDKIKVK
ncbi:MAG: hypothetical protein E7399_03925 [Ruminococcaceae bacterium]|nr:hypothetical protein [Oscillospiraceae bacterium]